MSNSAGMFLIGFLMFYFCLAAYIVVRVMRGKG